MEKNKERQNKLSEKSEKKPEAKLVEAKVKFQDESGAEEVVSDDVLKLKSFKVNVKDLMEFKKDIPDHTGEDFDVDKIEEFIKQL